MNWTESANALVALSEQKRLYWHIFDLEHELEIGGHNDGYSCMECWRLEDAGLTFGR